MLLLASRRPRRRSPTRRCARARARAFFLTPRIVDADKAAALEALAQRIERIRTGQDFVGVVFGVLLRRVAEARCAAVVPPATRIGRHAPHGDEAEIVGFDAAVEEMHQVRVAEPGAEMARLGRTLEATADAHTHALDAVLVP